MKKVTGCFYVSSQIDVDSVRFAKEQGFDQIICNRPNNEENDHCLLYTSPSPRDS